MGTIIHGFPGAGGGGGGASAMSDLTDVDLTSLSDGNILVYNGTNSKWVNFALSLGTAAAKDSTSSITQGSTDLIESGSVYAALADKVDTSLVGAASGIAELDSSGKVPSSQLPSFVDDVIEVEDYNHLPITGESGKIYVTVDDNKTYRWTGSTYAEISESLALGETSSTAYRGDRGKTAYDHSQDSGRVTAAVTSGLYKVAATAQGHIASLTAVQKSDITGLGIPESDTNTTYTFTSGTNKFTVTPSGGTAQDVAVTPSITNNVTGSGTSGYIAKFNGANTITNGPAFGSATTTFLRNDGSWATPTDHTYNFDGTTFYSGNSGNAGHDCNAITDNGHYYYSSNGPATSIGASTADGALYVQAYSTSWVGQIAQDYRNGRLFVRGKNNGTWQTWQAIALGNVSISLVT